MNIIKVATLPSEGLAALGHGPLSSTSCKSKYCPAEDAEGDAQCSSSSSGSLDEAHNFFIGTQVPDGGSTECNQVFEDSMVAQGLSQLSRTASGNHVTFLRLDLNNTTLDSPEPIAHCRYLQHVNLSSNCLTTLKALGTLQQLVFVDASQNDLTEVLDFDPSTSGEAVNSSSPKSSSTGYYSSNLRSADLSFNLICQIRNLSVFRRLTRLVLDGNQIEQIGGGLKQLQGLQHLSLSGNTIISCTGLEGLTSLRELALEGNRLTCLAPLSGLTSLEVLLVAHNQLSSCEGIQGLSSLLRLDVSGNLLRRLEVLAAAVGLHLLGELDVAANPFEAAQNTRLCISYLLPQVSLLNGVAVSSTEKVDAANMAGAAAEGLLAIRRQYFAAGELDDGGGAVPPTAAGLLPSMAEEECSCRDPDAMFEAIDSWARTIQPSIVLLAASGAGEAAEGPASQPGKSAAAPATAAGTVLVQPPAARIGSSASTKAAAAVGTARNSSTCRSAATAAAAMCTGSAASTTASRISVVATDAVAAVAAVASRLAAGCSKEDPWAQLQLARVSYSWVVSHVTLPHGCNIEAGADAVTWDVGLHLFGEDEQQKQIHQALLPCHSGTWAECVSQLLVQLVLACHMEAVQVNGYWKAGGRSSVEPGARLATHNHSWVAVKVNGRWRLLDPVYAIVRQGQIPFYLPPEAFLHSHLPFEAYWQLLANPISLDQWWQMPEVSLAFCAEGGQLMDAQLRACNVLPAVREGQPLPPLQLSVAAPATDQQYICVKLLDHNKQLIASWKHKSFGSGRPFSSSSSRHSIRQLSQQRHSSQQLPALPPSQQQQQQQRQACLVYQQPMLSADGLLPVSVGHQQKEVAAQELWVSPPAPGTYYVHVEMVWETPHWMQLQVAGLPKPWDITYWQREDVIRVKVIVPVALPHDPSAGTCVDHSTPAANLPQPQNGFSSCGGFQLLNPAPCKALEADRTELFEVVAPGAAAVAVGCDELGWQELIPGRSTGAAAGDHDDCTGGNSSAVAGLFSGMVVLPRTDKCFVAGRLAACSSTSSSTSGWLPMVGLQVAAQVQDVVALPADELAELDPWDPSLARLQKMLLALDTDGDGVVSRRDMLLACGRDRQLADHLKMPPRIKVGDGSFDKFLAKFITINTDGLGHVNLRQLAAYMAAINSSSNSSGDSLVSSGREGPVGRSTGSRLSAAGGAVSVGVRGVSGA